MPMHIPSRIDTDWNDAATLTPKSGALLTPASPAARSDILGILQREQDHAMFLLSLSPLLSSLFVSYANRAASHESTSSTPLESDEWKILQNSITTLREENEKLQSENREIFQKLEAAQASQEGSRSHISSLGQVNAAQQNEISSLRKELVESKDLYERVMKDCNAEKAAYQTRISGIEAQLVELKQTVTEKQTKVSNIELQSSTDTPPVRPVRQTPPQVRSGNSPTPSETTTASHLRNLSLGGGEEASRPSSVLILTHEVDVPNTAPGPNEMAKPQPLSRGPPPPQKSQPHQKSLRGGWLKALNDSF